MLILKEKIMKRRKPKAGEKLFFTACEGYLSKPIGRACIVTKVGRKYFYVSEAYSFFEIKFHLDTWEPAGKHTSEYTLYESEQDWKDACEEQKND